ncbi:MAG: glutamate racemase [Chryseobacterium sp.]|nr:MAG: glutamate racemase [Chryseobacterium sp.]
MLRGPIGIFDSGYGGLTVYKSIVERLPVYDYLYFGDNARAPYGDHTFETVYQYTLECVEWLFDQGCPLVILACNTASAKALRTIQQNILPLKYPDRRVLGVIRPTAEVIDQYTNSKEIGVLGTRGTVQSESYLLEIQKLHPQISVTQQSCPMWVPLIENNEHNTVGADYFVKEYIDELMSASPDIDCVLLACTHYPLLLPKIIAALPKGVNIVIQGDIVAVSLAQYLEKHPQMEKRLTRQGIRKFFTSGSASTFDTHASVFFGNEINSERVLL